MSNPHEIHTISHWPSVGGEVYHSQTLTAICKSTLSVCVWGYPARQDYVRHSRRNGEDMGYRYFRELKQSLTKNDIDAHDHQPVVEYLQELGKLVLDYLQRNEYPEELLLIDHLPWCFTVPSNWNSVSKDRLCACLVGAGRARNQVENKTCSSSFDIFFESDAAARHCYNSFSQTNLKKDDRICTLDVGSGNVQCIFEYWDDAERSQNLYGARSSRTEILVEENFLDFICVYVGYSSGRQLKEKLAQTHPSLLISLYNDLEILKVDSSTSVTQPFNCFKMKFIQFVDCSIYVDITTTHEG